jgi:hypothetical protein
MWCGQRVRDTWPVHQRIDYVRLRDVTQIIFHTLRSVECVSQEDVVKVIQLLSKLGV